MYPSGELQIGHVMDGNLLCQKISSAAIRSWSCLDVFLSTLNPSWLSCRILCFSSYADSMDVRVFVKKLYIVFTNAIGLWFVNFEGFFFV